MSTWAISVTFRGQPVSVMIVSTSRSRFASSAEAKRCIAATRSPGAMRVHGPVSNARRAASTAASNCAGDDASTSTTPCSVAGSSTVKRPPSPGT